MNKPQSKFYKHALNMTVLTTGLGYFVDTFDFFLYNSMRVASLTDLGLSGSELTTVGIIILNCQILGALIGSFFWGILGDKVGRKSTLLASIFIFSLGMIINGFIQDVISYSIVRFIIGFGVAGEVGVGATLVAETIASTKRTYALMFFTIMGVLGIVIAALSLEFMSWRLSCFLGGGLGLLLLLLRAVLFESHLFIDVKLMNMRRGSLRDLFGNFKNLKKYIFCILILGSNFYITGILMTLAPEIGKATGTQGIVKANVALALYFTVAIFGDGLGALLSEIFKSRRIVLALFILGNLSLSFFFLQRTDLQLEQFYILCALFGIFNLWALTGTVVVEQFPTTLRATVATTSFNFSRATVVVMNQAFLTLRPTMGVKNGLMIIGFVMFTLALMSVLLQQETYGRSLAEV